MPRRRGRPCRSRHRSSRARPAASAHRARPARPLGIGIPGCRIRGSGIPGGEAGVFPIPAPSRVLESPIPALGACPIAEPTTRPRTSVTASALRPVSTKGYLSSWAAWAACAYGRKPSPRPASPPAVRRDGGWSGDDIGPADHDPEGAVEQSGRADHGRAIGATAPGSGPTSAGRCGSSRRRPYRLDLGPAGAPSVGRGHRTLMPSYWSHLRGNEPNRS